MLRLPKSAVSTKWSKARKRRNSRPRRNRRARSFRRRSLPCATSAIRACAKSAARTKLVKQIIDLALLSNGLLKGKKPDGVHPTQYLTDREIAVNYRISKRRLLFGAAAILYRIKSYGTPIRGSPSTKIRNIFLLGKTEMIDWRFVKNSVNYRFFSNSP